MTGCRRTVEDDVQAAKSHTGLDEHPSAGGWSRPAGDDLVARTFFTEDPGGREDLERAGRALPAMSSVREHVVFSTASIPGFYENLYGLASDGRIAVLAAAPVA